jgi:hypothetical protein
LILTRIWIAQVNAYFAVYALKASWTHAQIPKTRVIIANATVLARKASTRSHYYRTIKASKSDRTSTNESARWQISAVTVYARIALARWYDLIAEGASVAWRAAACVLLSVGQNDACTAICATVIQTRTQIGLTECASVADWALTNK